MSFHESCDLIRVEVRGDGTWLLAAAGNGDDGNVPAELRLDDHIGNSDGKPLLFWVHVVGSKLKIFE